MKTIVIKKKINSLKLYDELLNARLITPLQSNETSRLQGNELFIEDADDIVAIQSIIDAHDPIPVPSIPSKEEILEQGLANTNAMILELTELILGGM